MRTDEEIRDSVLQELDFEPSVHNTDIGVIVKNGVVTLTGHVPSYAEKIAAEKAVARVMGVRAIAEEIDVHLPSASKRTDGQIAEAAANVIRWNSTIPAGKVSIKVEEGIVYLHGDLDWQFQKDAAHRGISQLAGVRNVVNRIKLVSPIKAGEVRDQIKNALLRSARIDANSITVETHDHEVILKGKVRSWSEIQEAKKAAYNVKGVWTVKTELAIA